MASINFNKTSNYNDFLQYHKYNATIATTPTPRDCRIGWHDKHQDHEKLANTSKADIVIFGDSIAYGLTRYSNIWHKNFPKQSALNFGIPGDHIENILWRVQNIKLPANIKYAIFQGGTNNLNHDAPEDIANAISIMAYYLLHNHPNIKIIVSGLLPRDSNKSSMRKKTECVNSILSRNCSNQNIAFIQQLDG